MKNVNSRRVPAACVAIGLATLGLAGCRSGTKGGAASSATAIQATASSTAAVSATAAATAAATSAVATSASAAPSASSAPATATTAAPSAVATSASAGPSDSAAKAAPNPCSLVTAADASAALGSSAPTGLHQPAGLFDACIYAAGAKSVVILVRSIDQATFDASAKANPGGATPVTGVGSDAYNASQTLLVWQAGTEIGIQVQAGSGDTLTTEKRLASAAVARL